MAYIGTPPSNAFTSLLKQDFTTSVTTGYTLDHAVNNANDIALFINFVRQEPTAAYSASGTTLTLTSATASSDDMYCVYLGQALQTVNPPNASVGLSQLTATGTKNSTTFLRGDNTFNAPSVASLSTASGSAPSYSARAWIKFNGTGTVAIIGSANVSSISDVGTGDYTINIATALPTNYTVVSTPAYGLLSTGNEQFPVTVFNARTTSAIDVASRQCDNDAPTFVSADSERISCVMIG